MFHTSRQDPIYLYQDDDSRKEKCIDGYDIDKTITQDELDYNLKAKLRVSPEERYQAEKRKWYFHKLSYSDQTTDDYGRLVDVVKEYGCGHGSNKREEGGCCVPECRFYREYGRIEDEEVIEEHNKYIWPDDYGLRAISDQTYYPMQFEVIEQSVSDWDTNDKSTMMIQIGAIAVNYDLKANEDSGKYEYIKGFSYPLIGDEVYVLNQGTVRQMYNQKVLEKMQWNSNITTNESISDNAQKKSSNWNLLGFHGRL